MSEELLKSIYYNPKTGLQSAQKLYQKARERDPSISLSTVKKWLANQSTKQIFYQHKPKHSFPLYSQSAWQRVQIDLMDMSAEVVNQNRGFKWIFNCIDTYSRYVISIPMKTKNLRDVMEAFKKILMKISEMNSFLPSQIDSDNESSFISNEFKSLCKEYHIYQNLCNVGDKKSMGIVERFNRTLRLLIEKYKTAFNTVKWIQQFDDLIQNYNTTFNNGIGMSPKEALNPSSNEKINEIVDKKYEKARKYKANATKINVNDKVRLLLKRTIFEKSTAPRYTKSIHTVERIENNNYYVSDRVNPYKTSELLKIDNSQDNPYLNTSEAREQPERELKEHRKNKTNNRRLNKEGISQTNIQQLSEKRIRRKPVDRGAILSYDDNLDENDF